MLGAVLVQHTAWHNAAQAVAALRDAGLLEPHALLALPEDELAQLIRPSGTYRVKARRLRALCQWLEQGGGLIALSQCSTAELRRGLLGVYGVGPETTDAILLYAFQRPVFVIDTYARRLFARLGMISGDEHYEALRAHFETALAEDSALFNEYHALIVAHGKAHCTVCPRCAGCPLGEECDFFRADSSGTRS